MNLPDTVAYLTWLSQTDGRIQVTDASVQVWHNALATVTTAEVKHATLEYYKTNEQTIPSPAIIRKHAHSERDRAVAKQSALEAGPVIRNPHTYRQRNPEQWDQLFNQGQDARRADLQRRGIAA